MEPAVNEDVISFCTGSVFRDLAEELRNMMKNLSELVIFRLQLQAAF
jgi:D-mannonate dehydratase